MKLKCLVASLALAGLIASPAMAAGRASASGLGWLVDPSSTYSYSSADRFNDVGQAVGSSSNLVNGQWVVRTVMFNASGAVDLGTFGVAGGLYPSAYGINNSGSMVATVLDGSSYANLLYTGGSWQRLSGAQWDFASVRGINDRGQILGNGSGGPFMVSGGVKTDLATIGVGGNAYGWDLNNLGQAVGVYSCNSCGGSYRAAYFANGQMTELGLPAGGTNSSATGINDSGQIIGTYTDASNNQHFFLRNQGQMYDISPTLVGAASIYWVSDINNLGQLVGEAYVDGHDQATVITLHPDWTGGDGNWNDASRWNYAGFGAFGIQPGQVHDVVINPGASATIMGANSVEVRSLAIGGSTGSIVTFNLAGGRTSTAAGTAIATGGVVAGSGRLDGGLDIRAGGRVWVKDGESTQFGGNVTSAGSMDVQARNGVATLEIGGHLDNHGTVNLLNADLRVYGGTTNASRVSIAGYTTVTGSIDNLIGAQVNVSGVNSQAIFWDDFRNNGSVNVTTGSTATFFGLVNGAGSFLGGGTKQFAGGYSPGNSPALVTVEGPISFQGGTVTMDLGGQEPGAAHDKMVFAGPVEIAGAQLSVIWYDGFIGHAGDQFDLFDWNGGVTGSFALVALPVLEAGLGWDTSNLYTTGELGVFAVPELHTDVMFLAGLGVMGCLMRRRCRPH